MQSVIDSISYPPTHTYRLDGLVPTGVLAQRMSIICGMVPDFFEGDSFLDIGANKGYFSLRAAKTCNRVTALEVDEECCNLLAEILPENARLQRGSFGDLNPKEKYDSIFIGNVHHYIFNEFGGWKWVDKLAKMSVGSVVLEGPMGMECEDMRDCINEDIKGEFNAVQMQKAFGKYFYLIDVRPTTGYTPDRYVIHYDRK